MTNKFNNRFSSSPVQNALKGFNVARTNLLLVAALTIVNILLLVTGSDTYFLFSASIPYIITSFTMYLCGMYAEEYYEGGYASYEFLDKSVFAVALVISLIIIAVYFLLYFLLKKRNMIWLVITLALFSVDTVVMFAYYGFSLDMLIDIIFHIYLIVSFSIGIYTLHKFKKMEKNGELYQPSAADIVPPLTETKTDDGDNL